LSCFLINFFFIFSAFDYFQNGSEKVYQTIKIKKDKVGVQFRNSLSQLLSSSSETQVLENSAMMDETEADHSDLFSNPNVIKIGSTY
jgi:hypothetical protein